MNTDTYRAAGWVVRVAAGLLGAAPDQLPYDLRDRPVVDVALPDPEAMAEVKPLWVQPSLFAGAMA